jgi:NAD(P)-dependent dehydrogenase (short-subunit alcohol dehydrogenase family)
MYTPKNSFTRSALVTGTSSGIGKATSLRLAAEGVNVFAGVRRSADGDALLTEASRISEGASNKKGRVIPVILDVISDVSIKNAIESVHEENWSAWALGAGQQRGRRGGWPGGGSEFSRLETSIRH